MNDKTSREKHDIQVPQVMLADTRWFDTINLAMQELLDRLAVTLDETTTAGVGAA